ncbi:MAG: isoaspartyl peptidase/L-asparaginase [Bacteroidota bacterium]
MSRRRTLALVIHGGAWDIPDDRVAVHRKGIANAVQAGWDVLEDGGSAVEAVEQSIVTMEDDETFDAGRGSALNEAGEVELDAGIMSGKLHRAGSVAGVQNVLHPISLARAIMEDGECVMLVGRGASRFAREHRVPTCSQDDLITERQIELWREAHLSEGRVARRNSARRAADTVGAVALDGMGDIAAGTSTGGPLNRRPGRVGDTPLIGCGTYADNAVGGVSVSGDGEAMISAVMAKSVIDLMSRNGEDPEGAAREGIALLASHGRGKGGIIVVSRAGTIGVAFNTPRMARGYMTSSIKSPRVIV